MVFFAAAVAILGVILKLIAAEPAGQFLVPMAMGAGIYHVFVHVRAARLPEPPIGLAVWSNALFMAAILLQIDYGWTAHCGTTTYDGVAWSLGWSSNKGCTLIRGFPAFVLDVTYYMPVAATWRWLRQRAQKATTGRAPQ